MRRYVITLYVFKSQTLLIYLFLVIVFSALLLRIQLYNFLPIRTYYPNIHYTLLIQAILHIYSDP